jgi:hypothetical protein
VQVASKAFIPQHAGRPSLAFTGADKSAMSNRHAIQPGDRCPSKYSEEEAYYRTGVSGGATPYAANELGGALRRLRVYGQDAVGKSTGETLCTKYKGDNKKLNAGMFVRLLLLVFLRQLRSTCCFSCQGLERLHILASCCPHFHGIKGAEVQKCMSSLKEMGDFRSLLNSCHGHPESAAWQCLHCNGEQLVGFRQVALPPCRLHGA